MASLHELRKTLKRTLLKNAVSQWLLCALIAAYIRLVYYTNRRHIHISPGAEPYIRGENNALFAFWHARLMLMPMICPPRRRMHVMISSHHDGLVIAQAMRFFGFGIVHGSSRRGGAGAARSAAQLLELGENVSITPDGPKGPAMKLQQGAVALARMTGRPILPISYTASRHRRFNSWDKFMVALPLGRIHYAIGAPYFVREGISDEQAQREFEAIMIHQTEELDRDLLG